MSTCPRCGGEVACGMNNPDAPCWCTAYPAVMPVPQAGAASCFCAQCLQAVIAEQTEQKNQQQDQQQAAE